jgi:hypothetical protein
MQHNPIDQFAQIATEAGFRLTGAGNRRPWLHYFIAQREPDATANT